MKLQKKFEIEEFVDTLDKLILSKYIMAERRISDVLQGIARTSDVYNLIAKCMVNFDFKAKWKEAISTRFFRLPDLDEDRIAFIFCLFSNIDDKNIDFTGFLSEYFSAINSYSAYELFSKTVVVEFKRLLLKFLGYTDDDMGEDYALETNKKDNFSLLASSIDELLKKIKTSKKIKSYLDKNDLIAVLSTFLLTAEKKETEYFYAFRVMLNSALAKSKALKDDIEKINQIVDTIIRGIYE